MARGDYIEVTYKTGVGTEKKRIIAHSVGATVEMKGTSGREEFVTVEELNKNGKVVHTGLFAKPEVVAITQGNAPIPREGPVQKAAAK